MDQRPKDLNARAKTIKPLEESIREKLHNIAFGNDFLDMTPKAMATKRKVGIETTCALKETHNSHLTTVKFIEIESKMMVTRGMRGKGS
jgi:hypothetical protein